MNNEWLGVEQLAKELGVSPRTIYAWRSRGEGPRAARFGKHLRYRRSDVERWVQTKMDPSR